MLTSRKGHMKTKMNSLKKIPVLCIFLIDALVYLLAGGLSYTAAYPLSALVLAALALFHYAYCSAQNGTWVNLTGVFFLSWIGGQALASLRLSRLLTQWEPMTWVVLFISVELFMLGALAAQRVVVFKKWQLKTNEDGAAVPAAESLGRAAVILTVLSLICLITETAVLGYLPIFSPKPHAYSYFHLKGLHYITVSAMYVPALAVLYQLRRQSESQTKTRLDKIVWICAGIGLLVPILCVSRYQLFMAVFLALICYVLNGRKLTPKMIAGLFIAAICGYAVLTILRHHDIEYLNGIFEPRWKHMPIFITQPYMYIANNYQNLNCLIKELTHHSFGARSFAPIWSLIGMKHFFPEMTELPDYLDKIELSTLTIFYDSYYDFGIAGVGVLAFILGWFGDKVQKFTQGNPNPVAAFLYAQVIFYYLTSFFDTWTSNLAVWFGLFIALVLYVYVERRMRRAGKNS